MRPGPRRALSAARAAPVAAGEEAHASREVQGPRAAAAGRRRQRDLARVKRLSLERRARATTQPDAPPSLPSSLPRLRSPCAPPGCCGGRFPGTFQESASRDRGPRYCFKEARALMRRLRGRRARSAPVRVRAMRLLWHPLSSDPTAGSAGRRRRSHRPPPSGFGGRSLPPTRASRRRASNRHPRPSARPGGLSFPSPLRLSATLQAALFVSQVQERPEVFGNGPSCLKAHYWGGGGPFPAPVPTPESRREQAGGCALGPGPRRQPAGGERRLLKRRWPLSVPSPGRSCWLSPAPAQPDSSPPRPPLRCTVSLPPPGGPPRSPAPPAEGRAEVLGGGPRCLSRESAGLCAFPQAWRPGTGNSERSGHFSPARDPHLLPPGWRPPGHRWNLPSCPPPEM